MFNPIFNPSFLFFNSNAITGSVALIPQMTSNTAPYGIASDSLSSTDAWKAFTSIGYTNFEAKGFIGSTPTFILYQFIKNYNITSLKGILSAVNAGTAIQFQFQYSTDGVNWASISPVNVTLAGVNLSTISFGGPYIAKYVRWVFVGDSGTSLGLGIEELQVYGN